MIQHSLPIHSGITYTSYMQLEVERMCLSGRADGVPDAGV